MQELNNKLAPLLQQYEQLHIDEDVRNATSDALNEIIEHHRDVTSTRTLKILTSLYGGSLAVPKQTTCYLNLPSKTLTEKQIEYLNLGLNCHLFPKFDQITKKVNIALLYDDLLELQAKGVISIGPNAKELLQEESTKRRHHKVSGILTGDMKDAAYQLRNNENIVIRKADKAATHVLLDREEYLAKCRSILSDDTKFQRITRNTTEDLKKNINSLITAANAHNGGIKFEKVMGDFNPGYFYGNVKTHKAGNPLRPIISQIPTPSYSLLKKLNTILMPYIPTSHSISSTREFINIIKINTPNSCIASLDIESLYTNVPVSRTIEIILNYAYLHPTLPPPSYRAPLCKECLSRQQWRHLSDARRDTYTDRWMG